MGSAVFDPDTVRSRLRELAFLNSAVTIRFRALGEKSRSAAAEAEWETFHFRLVATLASVAYLTCYPCPSGQSLCNPHPTLSCPYKWPGTHACSHGACLCLKL